MGRLVIVLVKRTHYCLSALSACFYLSVGKRDIKQERLEPSGNTHFIPILCSLGRRHGVIMMVYLRGDGEFTAYATGRVCRAMYIGPVRPGACRSGLAPAPARWPRAASAARRLPFANSASEPHSRRVAD